LFPVHNRLLLALPAEERARFAAHLRHVHLPHGAVLHETGRPIERVYFPESGAVSLVVDLMPGETIETALIGLDGAVGGNDALHQAAALNRAVMQIDGSALAIESEALRKICDERSGLRRLLAAYDRFVHAQAHQAAACNVAHTLDARVARWLLRAQNLCSNKFLLTQEALAALLGVRRTSVSLTAHAFQDAGTIRYRRGEIEIVDTDKLRGLACECHAALAAHREQLMAEPAMNAASARGSSA
jgi:CRP-like cAMP-binding protein